MLGIARTNARTDCGSDIKSETRDRALRGHRENVLELNKEFARRNHVRQSAAPPQPPPSSRRLCSRSSAARLSATCATVGFRPNPHSSSTSPSVGPRSDDCSNYRFALASRSSKTAAPICFSHAVRLIPRRPCDFPCTFTPAVCPTPLPTKGIICRNLIAL